MSPSSVGSSSPVVDARSGDAPRPPLGDGYADIVTTEPVPTDADPGEADAQPALDRLAAELEAVASALTRLESGTYWSDEISGEPLDDSVLAADPTARRNP